MPFVVAVSIFTADIFVCDIAIFVPKRDVKLQLSNQLLSFVTRGAVFNSGNKRDLSAIV